MDWRTWFLKKLEEGLSQQEIIDEANRLHASIEAAKEANRATKARPMSAIKNAERESLMAKARELGSVFVDLGRVTIEDDALESVPASVVREHEVLPVKRIGSTLWLAIGGDSPISVVDKVAPSCLYRILPVLAFRDEILQSIERYYPSE